MALDPLLVMAIAGGVKHLLGGIGAKKRVNAEQDLEKKKYDDQVSTYFAEFEKSEDDRMKKLLLVQTFAKANGLDSALTPEVLAALSKRRTPAAPPPYRKGGTPGFGWDLAANLAGDAAAIYSAAKGKKPGPAAPKFSSLSTKSSSFGSAPSFGSANAFFQRPAFSNPPNFG